MYHFIPVKRIGVLYHPKVKKSEQFALKLKDFFKSKGIDVWCQSSWDEEEAHSQLGDSAIVISVGGDGTILRVARIVFPHEIPIVGINFGNLGFMTELEAEGAIDGLTQMIEGKGWIDQRVMLQATVQSTGKTYYALNVVVIGRGKHMRLINIEVRINGVPYITYRADAVIVATATGSTGYSLAANGPIIYPESGDMILKAVCPHLSMDKSLVLSPETEIKLKVLTNHEAIISMDGQVEAPLANEEEIVVGLSHNVSKFIRLRPRDTFYATLATKLKGKSL
jgi:NAD+ kinase